MMLYYNPWHLLGTELTPVILWSFWLCLAM